MAFTTDLTETPHPNVITGSTAQIPMLEMHSFQLKVKELLAGGSRLVGFFGSPSVAANEVHLNAVLADDSRGSLQLLRTNIERQGHYRSFTADFPQFHCFEREVFEQYGVRPTEHPWLKPIRYPDRRDGGIETYPFYNLEGKEVHEVGVGPIHAGIIEPGHFRFMCYGEKVHHLEIQLGYQHRGVEQLLLEREPGRLAPLVETVSGDSSVAHAWAYCLVWEALCGASATYEMDLVRGIALELERMAMHLAGLSGMATDIGFLPGGSTYGRLRTTIINTSMRLCGSRFGRGWLRPGEVRCILDAGILREVENNLRLLERDIRGINELFMTSMTVQHRLKRTGKISREKAAEMGFVGMAARSAGVFQDVRTHFPGRLYGTAPIKTVVEDAGDCWARAVLRIREIDESLRWLFSACEAVKGVPNSAQGHTPYQVKLADPKSSSFAISLIEGWRGEVMHYIETSAQGRLIHYKVQDPSLRNWFAVALAVRENAISDFPICNKSFDLSYCGQDL